MWFKWETEGGEFTLSGGRIVGIKQDPLVQRDLHTFIKRNVFHADKTEVKEYNLPKPTVTSTPIEMPPEVEAIYRDVATQFSVVLEGAARKFRERKKTDSYGDRQAEKVFSRMLAPIIKLLTDMANRPAKALRDVAFAIDNGYLPDFVTPVKPDGTGGEPRALPKQFMSVLRQWQEQHSAEDLEAMADQVGNPKLKAAEDTIVAKIERAKGSRSLLFSDDKAMCMEAGQHMAETMTGTHVVGLNDGIHFFRGTTELERLVYPLDTALLAKLVKENKHKATKDDVQEGLVAAVKVTFPEPQFRGQTKQELGTPAIEGIVSRVVPREELLATALAIAGRITGNAPLAVQAAKELSRVSSDLPLDEALRFGGVLRWMVGQTPLKRWMLSGMFRIFPLFT